MHRFIHAHLSLCWYVRQSAVVLFLLILGGNVIAQTTISVIPNQAWTATGLTVTSGQQLSITASGELDWQDSGCSWPNSNNCTSGPNGPGPTICDAAPNSQNRPAPGLPCNSLIGRIGSNGAPFEVGTALNSTATDTGELYLGVNDSYFPDNSGGWKAVITISVPAACVISATTLAHVPGTDDKTRSLPPGRIGVGENVVLTLADPMQAATYPVTWEISNGNGTLTPDTADTTLGIPPPYTYDFVPNEGFPTEKCSGTPTSEIQGAQACFVAPSSNGSTTITATVADGLGTSCSATITTVQPRTMIFQRLTTPPGNRDYTFDPFYGYIVIMESVAFVTPGDVSFANVLFQERDVYRPRADRRYNALFNFGGNKAWLVGCDYDKRRGFGLISYSETSPFAYAVIENLKVGPFTEFVNVETAWMVSRNFPNNTIEFSKRQVGISADGPPWVDAPVPDSLAAVLDEQAVRFNDFVALPDISHEDYGFTCLRDVQEQFSSNIVPSP